METIIICNEKTPKLIKFHYFGKQPPKWPLYSSVFYHCKEKKLYFLSWFQRFQSMIRGNNCFQNSDRNVSWQWQRAQDEPTVYLMGRKQQRKREGLSSQNPLASIDGRTCHKSPPSQVSTTCQQHHPDFQVFNTWAFESHSSAQIEHPQ